MKFMIGRGKRGMCNDKWAVKQWRRFESSRLFDRI
jgi:hypothetical protein